MKKYLILFVALLFAISGCAGTNKSGENQIWERNNSARAQLDTALNGGFNIGLGQRVERAFNPTVITALPK